MIYKILYFDIIKISFESNKKFFIIKSQISDEFSREGIDLRTN